MDAFINRTLNGYEIREEIGAGGMGMVYRAFQTSVGREVAIKVTLPQRASQPEFIRRFEVEAQVIARLEHPHIVPLFDYWRSPEGAFLVMRWLPSNVRLSTEQGPWALEPAARLLDQMAGALTAAHREGIVHRDIKPANILLDEDKNAYLADFGIAQDIHLRSTNPVDDSVEGTPEYMTPESIRGGAVTPRTDLYSLGYVMYELLTGSKPFPDATTSSDYMRRHLSEPLPMISVVQKGIPPAVDEVLQTATAKDPSHRYPNALRFAAAFRAALPTHVPRISGQPLQDPLTERELDVLRLMVDGLSNSEIATKLFLTAQTVKWYVKQIYDKLDAHSRQQAVDRARALRLFEQQIVVETNLLSVDPPTVRGVDLVPAPLMMLEPDNPYKGLRAFQETDAHDFYGRAALTERLLSRLSESGDSARFLVVVGPSGSGKSSVVRAGLIPALRSGALMHSPHPFIADLMPGTHPLEELEAALLRVSINPLPDLLKQLREDRRGLVRAAKRLLPSDQETELILIVDQFEEVFTLVEDEGVRTQFIDNLLSAATDPRGRVRVILTLRADFYDRPLSMPRLAELVREHTEVIIPLSAREMEQAITAPAERVGLQLEAGLVTTIINDVGEQPGALPLLQYALTELVERREGLTLTLDAYKATGGVMGALARRADDIYSRLNADSQQAARQLFLRLITLGEGAEDTRRRTLLSEITALGEENTMEDVINAFADYRLLTLDRDPLTHSPTVEIAHEALIREWNTMREWVANSREDIRTQRRLAQAAAEWNVGSDNSFLASGTRLTQFESWASGTSMALTTDERGYLSASLAERERHVNAEQLRQSREHMLELRSLSRLRLLVGVLVIAVIGALLLSGLALTNAGIARENEALAVSAQTTLGENLNYVNRQRLAGLANNILLSNNENAEYPYAALLALRSLHDGPLAEGDIVLQTMMKAGFPEISLNTAMILDPTLAVAFSPDGRYAATGDTAGLIHLWDATTGEEIRIFSGHEDETITLEFSPDSTSLISANADNTVRLWDVETGEPIHQWDYQGVATQASFSPDGQRIAVGGEDLMIHVYDTQSRTLLLEFEADPIFVDAVIFSPDGRFILSGGDSSEIRLWDSTTGELIRTYLGHTEWVQALTFNHDGSQILSGSRDTTARLWDTQTGEVLQEYRCTAEVGGVDISSDGTEALISCGNKAQLWDLETQALLREYPISRVVSQIRFSPDDEHFIVSNQSSRAYIWETHPADYLRQFGSHAFTKDVTYSPDGHYLATADNESVMMWDLETDALVWEQADEAGGGFNNVDFSPDGRLLAAANGRVVQLYDAVTGSPVQTLTPPETGDVWGLDFSPDGTKLVTGTFSRLPDKFSGKVIVWDLASGTLIWDSGDETQNSIVGTAFSPDGRTIVSGSHDTIARLWDAETGEVLQRFQHPNSVYQVAFSHDGRYVATAGWDSIARLWDITTGEVAQQFVGHTNIIGGIDLSSDDRYLATGSTDGTVRVWDTKTGEMLRTLVDDDFLTIGVSFSPDDQFVAAGSSTAKGGTRIGPIDIEPMIEYACAHLAEDIRPTIRSHYGIDTADWSPTCPSNPNIISDETSIESVYAAGDFNREAGCIADGIPDCEFTQMKDDDGDGIYTLTLDTLPSGTWTFFAAWNGRLINLYGVTGTPNSRGATFTLPSDNVPVTLIYDSHTDTPSAVVEDSVSQLDTGN